LPRRIPPNPPSSRPCYVRHMKRVETMIKSLRMVLLGVCLLVPAQSVAAQEKPALTPVAVEQLVRQMFDGDPVKLQGALEQLEARGISLRMQELRKALQQTAEKIGTDESFATLQQRWRAIWQTTSTELEQGLAWKTESMAETFAARDTGLLPRLKKSEPEQPAKKPAVDTEEMWDNWAQTRLNDALDNLIVEADALAVPTAPLRAELPGIRDNARGWIENHLQTSLRAALLKPGTALQRFIYRSTGLLATILPLAALSWVGYRVFVGYYQSALAPEQYLGINFTTHSVLLVLTAWLIPWLAHRKLKPSLQKAALRGLQTGLGNGLSEIDKQTRKIIEKLHQQQQQLRQDSEQILQKHAGTETAPQPLDNETLARMLVTGSAHKK